MTATNLSYDVVIVGTGPPGLSFAGPRRERPLRVAMVEQLSTEDLARPPHDGRGIALAQRCAHALCELGI